MESIYRLSVVFITLLQHLEDSLVEAYICDSEYSYNGRPVDVPEDVYRTYCCKASSLDSSTTSYSRFSCAEEGGCCGHTDSQYCCNKLRLTLGLSIGAGFFVLFVIIIVMIYCCWKKKRACFEPADFDRSFYMQSQDTLDSVHTRGTRRDTVQPPSPGPIPQARLQSPHQCVPTAPPIPNSNFEQDNSPPPYDEVIKNPEVYPGTDKTTEEE